ncbi:MAG: adenylate/guanylate cyclase domain-containing protein [Stagnimonas sp.]|nr:adenylate/guanylate cyclase domain-containing protein [Stagnimonas sp.]
MASQHRRRRLAAVMFTDLVGYSALMRTDEAGTLRLLQAHFRQVRALLRRHGGQEIKTVGDAFLIRFGSALAALSCALAIQQDQAARNASAPAGGRLLIRIGIHLADIELRGGDLFGDGVNLAARVQALATPGGIAVSAAVRAQVHSELGRVFQSLGPQALKNIPEPVEVFLLDGEALAQAPLPAATAPAWRVPLRGRLWPALGVLLLLAALVSAGGWAWARRQAAEPPSIAVLPLQSLGADPADAWFAQGLQDELLSRLGQFERLRVIARGSTQGLVSQPQDLAEVARRLGVRYLIEGSVQQSGATLRIRLRLLQAASGAQLWAESYDRGRDDVLAVQSEIAGAVAAALSLRLSGAEQRALGQRATGNPAAYEAYLRGLARINQASPTAEDRAEAERQFATAAGLDPGFALAWAWWSRSISLRYVYNDDSSADARRRGRAALDQALRLQPELDQARLAQGFHEYWVEQRYAAARQTFEQLRQRWPNQAEPAYALALIARRTGRWDEALRQFEASQKLDPLNAPVLTEWGLTLMGMRRYAAARERFDAALAVTPGDPQLLGRKASAWLAEGRLPEAEALLQGLPLTGWDYVGAARFTLWLYQRRYPEIIAAVQGLLAELGPEAALDRGSSLAFLGWAQRFAGQAEAARLSFEQARAALAPVLREQPESHAAWQALASAEAGLGRAAEAVEAGERSISLLSAAGDVYWTPVMEEFQARAEAGLGLAGAACARIGRLLAQPYGEWPLTAADLELSPDWDGIRDQACFRSALVAARR